MRETVNDALVRLVAALGGIKQVGPVLWPQKEIDAAGRFLNDCLSEQRPARLSPEQLVVLFRLGREKGIHIGMEFLCQELDYEAPKAAVREVDIEEAIRRVEETTGRLADHLAETQAQLKQLLAARGAPPQLRNVA